MNVTAQYLNYTTTEASYDYNFTTIYSGSIISSVTFIICCIGIPLNGIVIWFLGFKIKRNPFTVLILNLAIADFGFLMLMNISCIEDFRPFIQPGIPRKIFVSLLNATYINGLFLLTAISIDRCVVVLLPVWHRYSRPKYLSPTICAFLWILSFILIGFLNTMKYFSGDLHLVVTAVLCLPMIISSAVILFIKICLKSKQIKRVRILVTVLITLLCFLIFTAPLYFYVFITHFFKMYSFVYYEFYFYLTLCASLNSSVNPVIYFLVGRKKRAHSRESIKVIFQRVFREDEAPEI